jgi:thioredoxin reductase
MTTHPADVVVGGGAAGCAAAVAAARSGASTMLIERGAYFGGPRRCVACSAIAGCPPVQRVHAERSQEWPLTSKAYSANAAASVT